jgi:hypothetical protein
MSPQHQEHQPDLAQLVAYFDSDDIFIKSIHYESPSAVTADYLIAPNARGEVRILFLGFEAIASLELLLTEVECLVFEFKYEIVIKAHYDAFLREYVVTLNNLKNEIRCRGLSFSVQPIQ